MADAAGVVLTIPGLVLTFVQYYEASIAYLDQEKTLQDLCVRFRVEQTVFNNWKAKAMPDGQTVLIRDPAVEELTRNCLDQILAAFDGFLAISTSYDSSEPTDSRFDRAWTALVLRAKKVGWALSKEKATNGLWQKLCTYNKALNKLWNLGNESIQRQLLPELDHFNNTEGLQMLELALGRTGLTEYTELAAAVRLRRVALETRRAEEESNQEDAIHLLSLSDRNLRLTAGDFTPSISSPVARPRENRKMGESLVLLEWKSYETKKLSSLSKDEYQRRIGSSILSLAKLLSEKPKPTKLRALDCVGYYEPGGQEQSPRVCFAFQPPSNTVADKPIALKELIERGKKSFDHAGVQVDPFFFLGQRFSLALTLANAIYHLHYFGWLHKGIGSHNILFYRPSSNGQSVWKPDPKQLYLVGYNFARQASEADLSAGWTRTAEGTWRQHPRYTDTQDVNYEPSFDLYSLGVVLIELAYWRTAETLAEQARDKEQGRLKPHEWLAYVRKYLLQGVKERMGQVYGDVVRRCIEGDIGGDGLNTDAGYKDYLRSLDAQVLAKLELCFA